MTIQVLVSQVPVPFALLQKRAKISVGPQKEIQCTEGVDEDPIRSG